MAIGIPRGESDPCLESVVAALRAYKATRPDARIDVYRQDRFSIRIRVIDPAFARSSRPSRHDLVWSYLEKAPEEALGDVSTLLTLTPEELATSFANMEFENPVPSEF